jgi:hypothetical protein
MEAKILLLQNESLPLNTYQWKGGEKMQEDFKDIDIVTLVKVLVSVLIDSVKQQGKNVVLTNGNNNEVQIPNEEGPGGNVQV